MAGVSDWGIEDLDLDAYLGRIGVSEPTLHAVHTAHATGIPFENIDVLLGTTPALDLPSLQAKLVQRRRGGYCFEHNTLYAAALERLGFPVTRLIARPRLNTPVVRARTHMLLVAEADGETWLTDVGWGGGGLVEPMPLRETTVEQGVWTFGLVREDEQWVLRTRTAEGWFDLYAFTLEPQAPVDFEVANFYTAKYPASPFVGRLVLQTNSAGGRRGLVDTELTEAGPEGTRDKQTLTGDEVIAAIPGQFGIELTDEERAGVRAAIPA